MWLDAITLVVFVLFVITGAIRGTLATGMKLLSLLAAYAIAIWLAPRFGIRLAESLSIPGLLGVPLAGMMLFLGSYALLSMLAFVAQIIERRWRGNWPRTASDRAGGAAFGAVRGALIAVLLGWLALWMDGLRAAGGTEFIPDPGLSSVAAGAREVVETGGGLLLGDSSAASRVTIQLMARPAETVEGFQTLLENPHVRGLQSDDLFWSYVAHGSLDAALNQASFLGIAYDDTLRHQFADLGVVRETAASDPRLFRNAVKQALEEIQPRIKGLMNDPEVHALLQEAEVQRALHNGDAMALLRHPGVQRLVTRVTSDASDGE